MDFTAGSMPTVKRKIPQSIDETNLGYPACCLVNVLIQILQLYPELSICLILSQPGYVYLKQVATQHKKYLHKKKNLWVLGNVVDRYLTTNYAGSRPGRPVTFKTNMVNISSRK